MASKRRARTPDLSAASTTTTTTSSQTSRQSSANNSVVPSPFASRDSSPSRQPKRTPSSTRIAGNKARKNSQSDQSPSRPTRPSISNSNLPTRSLSSTSTPTLLPASQDTEPVQESTPQKPPANDNLRWPVSPRLRSPPPQFVRPGLPLRRSDQEVPSTNVQRPSLSPQLPEPSITSESEAEDPAFAQGMRTPVRGSLETVQEVSLPNSPNPTSNPVLIEKVKEKLSSSENYSDSGYGDVRTLRARPNLLPAHESGSDSSNTRLDPRRTTSVPPPLMSRQSSTMSTKQLRSKQDGSTQSMTVETETVPSVPQVVLTTGQKIEGLNGTLKAKPSNETIRPRKEKRKTRKQPNVNPGTASSKADVFEATIASAVDEANTSDSEETFVYDSNPPDANDRAGRRFHSRTPSATSMVSQADRQNLRSIYGVMEGAGPAHGPKKTMKFVNSFNPNNNNNNNNHNNNNNDSLTPGDEDGKGSSRSAGGSARGTTRHHHHIGRWGRQPSNNHTSLFDNESPFPNAARTKLSAGNSRNSSGPPSPRAHYPARGAYGKRSAMQMSSTYYDMDDTTGADDERTPLMGSIRSARSGRNRRGPHNLRQAESQTFTRRSSYLNRFAACLVLTMMFMLVITGAIGFMFATSQPLTGIEITGIHNVVTSDQVLLFDLTVKAHNPNIVVVTIDHANLEIFAKSEYAGTDSDWRNIPNDGHHGLGPVRPAGLEDDLMDDPPLDGPDDDDDSKPNVLLGRITVFDSPLTFEGSLFHQGTSSSTGQMQLEYPCNSTAGGSRRWERIYQNEFDLIVKGVVKYTLPMSARVRSATVSGRKRVKSNSANDPSLQPNSTTLD
ncbi:vacuolar segregation subunit 7-domain-containing protein [Mariannaea sp. PMI_226]|nr:vacuolar segregation subunit 7-domain-containing protein [Mariannaea sp. PMI_226]